MVGIIFSWGVMLVVAWMWSKDKLFLAIVTLFLWLSPVSELSRQMQVEWAMSEMLMKSLGLMVIYGALMVKTTRVRLSKNMEIGWAGLIAGYLWVTILAGDNLPWYLMWWWQWMVVVFLSWRFSVYVKQQVWGAVLVISMVLMVVVERLVYMTGGMY